MRLVRVLEELKPALAAGIALLPGLLFVRVYSMTQRMPTAHALTGGIGWAAGFFSVWAVMRSHSALRKQMNPDGYILLECGASGVMLACGLVGFWLGGHPLDLALVVLGLLAFPTGVLRMVVISRRRGQQISAVLPHVAPYEPGLGTHIAAWVAGLAIAVLMVAWLLGFVSGFLWVGAMLLIVVVAAGANAYSAVSRTRRALREAQGRTAADRGSMPPEC